MIMRLVYWLRCKVGLHYYTEWRDFTVFPTLGDQKRECLRCGRRFYGWK